MGDNQKQQSCEGDNHIRRIPQGSAIKMFAMDPSIWFYIYGYGSGVLYNHVQAPEAMCSSVKLGSLNDLSEFLPHI